MTRERVGRRLLSALADSAPAFTPTLAGVGMSWGRRLLSALADSSPAFHPDRDIDAHIERRRLLADLAGAVRQPAGEEDYARAWRWGDPSLPIPEPLYEPEEDYDLPEHSGEQEARLTAAFEVYRDHVGKFRWRLRTNSGQVLAFGGEAYETKTAALNGLEAVQQIAPNAKITDDAS